MIICHFLCGRWGITRFLSQFIMPFFYIQIELVHAILLWVDSDNCSCFPKVRQEDFWMHEMDLYLCLLTIAEGCFSFYLVCFLCWLFTFILHMKLRWSLVIFQVVWGITTILSSLLFFFTQIKHTYASILQVDLDSCSWSWNIEWEFLKCLKWKYLWLC